MIDLTSISKAVARDVNIQAEKVKNSKPPERERDIETVYNVRVANPVNVFQQMSIQDLINYMDTREGLDIDKFMSYLAPEQAKALVLVNLDVTTDLFKQMFDDMFASITPDEEIDDEAVLREEEEEYLRAVVAEGEAEDESMEDEEFLPDSDDEQPNNGGSPSNVSPEPFDDDDEELEDEEFIPDTDVEQPVEQSIPSQGIIAQTNVDDALIEDDEELFEDEEQPDVASNNQIEISNTPSVARVQPVAENTKAFDVDDSELDDDEEFVDSSFENTVATVPQTPEVQNVTKTGITQPNVVQSESVEVEFEDDFDEDEEFDTDAASISPKIPEPVVNNQVTSNVVASAEVEFEDDFDEDEEFDSNSTSPLSETPTPVVNNQVAVPVAASAEPVYEDEEFEEEEEFEEDEDFTSDIVQPEPQVTAPETQSQSVTPVDEFESDDFDDFSSDTEPVMPEPVVSEPQNQLSQADTTVTEFEDTSNDEDFFSDTEAPITEPVNQSAPATTVDTATDFEADGFEDFNDNSSSSNMGSAFEADDFEDFNDNSSSSNTGSTFEADDFEDFNDDSVSSNVPSAAQQEDSSRTIVAETPIERTQPLKHRSAEPEPKKEKSVEHHTTGTVSSKPVKSKKAIYIDDSELGTQEENKPAEKPSSSSKVPKSPASSSSISRSPKPASEGRESVAGEKYEKGWTLMRYLAENKGNREACHIDVVSRYYDKRLIRIGEEHGKFFIRNGYLRK